MVSHKMISLLLVGLLFAANFNLSEAHIGVTYGTAGNNLPAPEEVVALLEEHKISRVRLLEPNKEFLTALKGKDIEVMLGMTNNVVNSFNGSQLETDKWVEEHVKAYVPDVKIKYIVVGNEVSRNNDLFNVSFSAELVVNQTLIALQDLGLKDIKVTISCDRSVLEQLDPNPVPSTADFWLFTGQFLDPILKILNETGAPFMTSVYPYYEHIKFPNEINSEFALLSSTCSGLTDGKYCYQNKFDVMLDAYYVTLEKRGYPNMEIIVSETGWPSDGGLDATLKNEKTYITNLLKHVRKGTGTPRRPSKPIQVYLNLLDENNRGSPEIEKHFGVFTSDGKIKFPVKF
ncbi:glucan endo-1,3-beta-glucosidase, basic-like [Silene latifolia]|uniref:glucan endo-1,3-beta-glucosidase, basic-like n=1 Tax=Silene latifolia TaxID=37657 RepID=UPI003D77097D